MHPLYAAYLQQLKKLLMDLREAIAGLPQEALDWVPGPDMNSLGVLIVHTTGSARYWLGDIALGIPSNRDRDAEFLSHGLNEVALVTKTYELMEFAREHLPTFLVESWGEIRTRPAEGEQSTAGWAILHALEHTALHVGHAQITRQLWDQRSSP